MYTVLLLSTDFHFMIFLFCVNSAFYIFYISLGFGVEVEGDVPSLNKFLCLG